jgi:hypothetical protein
MLVFPGEDTFFMKRRCLVGAFDDSADVESLLTATPGLVRRFLKDGLEPLRNQLPLVEILDLRTAAISFFRYKILYFKLFI